MDVRQVTTGGEIEAGIERWNDLHPTVPFTYRLARQRIRTPAPGVAATAWGLFEDDDLAGFAVSKRLCEPVPGYDDADAGWLSLFAVDPLAVDVPAGGTELVTRVVDHLRNRGVETIRFGGDIRKFLPGLPATVPDAYGDVLEAAGFERGGSISDLYCDVAQSATGTAVEAHLETPVGVEVRRVRPDEGAELRAFAEREFPGRWAFQIEANCRQPGGVEDYWLVRKDDAPVAFARTGTADSPVLSSCVNWVGKWGDRYCGLGPIGVAEEERGNGYGLALIAAAMDEFRREGYHHMTIDGVADELLGYYAQLGFEPALEFTGFEYGA